MQCNVKFRKLLSAHKSNIRETSLFTGIISNPVRNSQTSRFVSVPGQNPGRSSRGDSVVLRLQSVMMADVWWYSARAHTQANKQSQEMRLYWLRLSGLSFPL